MQTIRIGGPYHFVPAAFTGEKAGLTFGGKDLPRHVRGTVTFIHRAHRFFLVTFEVNGCTLRECIKF